MSHPASAPADEGFISRNPGLTAVVFTFLVAAIFLGAIYRSATSGHGGTEHGEHAEHGDHASAVTAEGRPAAHGEGAKVGAAHDSKMAAPQGH